MGNLHISLSIFLLFVSCIAGTVAYPAHTELLSHNGDQQSVSYNPQPQDFPNEQLYRSYQVIQSFKSTITSDPKNVTATWTGNDICGETAYVGFYCGELPGRGANKLAITAVILNGFSLHAPKLQGFVDQLPDLALFHAASNNFGGDIPRLAGLPYLYELNVRSHHPVYTTVYTPDYYGATIDSAPRASLPQNCLTATIHFTFHIEIPGGKKQLIPGVTDAKALLLNHNNLFGPLPAELGFSKVSYLALANNKLTGPIPPSISHLQDSLFEVLLLNNQLSGCLPAELGTLHRSTVIDAGMNQLTGPIPSSFSCLSSVEQLNLGGNRLYGHVPDALCNLAAGPAGRLANLTLSGNYFTSVGPACAALVKNGVLDVKNNCIPGLANQRRPAECAAFQSQPKSCPAAAAATQVACPAGAAAAAAEDAAAATGERKAREYSSYVTYATLHE